MSATVKGWLRRLGARLSGATDKATAKTRKHSSTGSPTVERFKRHDRVPLASTLANSQESQLGELAYLDWTDDVTKNIGEAAIRSIRDALQNQAREIRRGCISSRASIDYLQARHGNGELDPELSGAIHNLMIKHYGVASQPNYVEAAKLYEQGADHAVSFINTVYLDPELIPALKESFAKPPNRLDCFGRQGFRTGTRKASEFLAWLLSQKHLFNIDGNYQLSITKMIVDMDALYRQEILPSLVEFPRTNKDVMPGSFPLEDNLVEGVRAESPDLRLSVFGPAPTAAGRPGLKSPGTAAPDAPATPSAGAILERTWPEALAPPQHVRKPQASRTPRPTKLPFSNPVAFFRSPGKESRPGPFGGRSAIRKAPTKLPVSPRMSDTYRRCTDKKSEASLRVAYHGTKYGEFVEEARRQLYGRLGKQPRPARAMPEESRKTEDRHETENSHEMEDPRDKDGAVLKSREAMTPEERRHILDLFVRDLELAPNGDVVRRKLLVSEAELMIATRRLEDMDLASQVRRDWDEAVESERQEMVRLLAEEKKLRLEEEKRRAEEKKRREEEEERRAEEEQRRRLEAERERELRAEREARRLREAEERARRTRLRAPTRAIITPISEEWRSRVLGIRAASWGVELTKTLEGQGLTRRDFEEKLLPPTAWLNDNVIIGSMLYIGEFVNSKAGATTQGPKCAALTSYFWPRLESAGPTQCGRLMRRAGVKKQNFLDIDSILIPICSGSHWTLAVVLPSRRIVTHMDSLRGGHGNPSVTKKLLQWVKATLEEGFVEEEWDVVDYDAPLQSNGWDCGVFTITNGLCMALGLDPNEAYTAQQLTLQRQRLAAMLLNGGFKGDFDLDGL